MLLLFCISLLGSLISVNAGWRRQQPKQGEAFVNRGVVAPNIGGNWRDSSKVKVWDIIGELNPHYQEFLKSLPAEFQNTLINPEGQISIIIPQNKPFTRQGTSIDSQTVQYNILTERMFSGQEGTKKYQTFHMNHNVMCYQQGGFLFMNDAMIKRTYQGSNGMIVVLDHLLPKPPHTKAILDEKTPFSQILLAIQRTYTNFDLNSIGSYFTIFAPILGMDWESFQKKANLNTDEKRDGFLLAHIVPNDVMLKEDMTAPKILKSGLQGFTYSLVPGKIELVNGRKIIDVDHFVSIGVVHLIEKPIATIEEIIKQAGSINSDNIKQSLPQYYYGVGDPLNSQESAGVKAPSGNQNDGSDVQKNCGDNLDQKQGFGDKLDEDFSSQKNMKGTEKNSSPQSNNSVSVDDNAKNIKDQDGKASQGKYYYDKDKDVKEVEGKSNSRWPFYVIIILLIVAGAMGSGAFVYYKKSKTKNIASKEIELPQ